MAHIHPERMTAEVDGEFVVFLIGMRVNRPWKIHKWWPVAAAMPRMLRELYNHPELGFLGHAGGFGIMVQYWRSFEHLEAYARSRDHEHLSAWKHFNRKVGASSVDVGIWHETYKIAPGRFEAVYGAMPAYGLGKVGRLVPVGLNRDEARQRMQEEVAEPEHDPMPRSGYSAVQNEGFRAQVSSSKACPRHHTARRNSPQTR